MSEEEHIKSLRIPLYALYYLDDWEGMTALAAGTATRLVEDYSSTVFLRIVNALEWAIRNPDFQFASLLPNLKYSNEQIHTFFVEVLKQAKS